MTLRSRARRAVALVGLAFRRVIGRTRIAPQRVLLSVLGVAIAVGLMVTVTGVSLGLASQSVIQSEGVDYWIVPEGASVESIAISSGGLKLGDVHDTTARISGDDRVSYATPVLLELLPVRDAATGERRYVLAAGVVPGEGSAVLGLPTDEMEQGDPHYANGSYDGPWTGEVVLNEGAARLVNASAGDSLEPAGGDADRSFTVSGVAQGDVETAAGTVPVALVHLSELQSMTGAASGDQGDQILVSTNDPAVRSSLESVYPDTTVVRRNGLSAQRVSASNLPLAVAISAFVSAVVVGVLFVATLMGLDVSADRQQLGVLAAVGFTKRSLSGLVAAETVGVAFLGGLVGLVLGLGGIRATNAVADELLPVSDVAVFDPVLIAYALVVAVVIGLLGAVYPVLLSRRTDVLEVLSE